MEGELKTGGKIEESGLGQMPGIRCRSAMFTNGLGMLANDCTCRVERKCIHPIIRF